MAPSVTAWAHTAFPELRGRPAVPSAWRQQPPLTQTSFLLPCFAGISSTRYGTMQCWPCQLAWRGLVLGAPWGTKGGCAHELLCARRSEVCARRRFRLAQSAMGLIAPFIRPSVGASLTGWQRRIASVVLPKTPLVKGLNGSSGTGGGYKQSPCSMASPRPAGYGLTKILADPNERRSAEVS
jgi:hypothetical protein